jgi:hypothetical protein
MDGGLATMKWKSGGEGSDNTAALMALTVIAHLANDENGIARATYDELCDATGLSRAKLSNGLQNLVGTGALKLNPDGRSTYQLAGYDPARSWAMFPMKSMYVGGKIAAFEDFKLRRPTELHALKLFYLFVAYRDRNSNLANIGYEKIGEYAGVKRERIKAAISLLASVPLVYVEQVPSRTNANGVSNAYRIVGIEPRVNMATRGRGLADVDLIPVEGRSIKS